MTPYEAFNGSKPDMGHIHLWGSRVWVRDLTAGKLDPRGREGRFIGCDTESKGCRIYWPNSRSIGVERDLIFEDRLASNDVITLPDSFPTKNKSPSPTPITNTPPITPPPVLPPDNTTVAPPAVPPIDAEPLVEPQAQLEPSGKRVRKQSPLVRDLLEGKTDGSTARGKSRILKGVQLSTGMTVTKDCNLDFDLDAAMVSAPDVDADEEDPRSLA